MYTRQRTGGHGNQCCYDSNDNIIVGPPSGGSVDKVAPTGVLDFLKHQQEDVIPYLLCCKWSRNCEKYYDRRPSDDGTAFMPPLPGK